MKKVGILGGIFDPVHNGHLHIADGVLRTLGLSIIYFIPAGDPPHKRSSPVADDQQRMEMLRMAIKDNPAFNMLDMEIKRPGKSYSVDTLTQLRSEHLDWDLHFIIGGDNLSEILSWKDPERVFELSNVVLVSRPGVERALSDVALPGEVIELQLPGMDISSTQIRQYIKEGLPCRYLLPAGVEEYILNKGLYR